MEINNWILSKINPLWDTMSADDRRNFRLFRRLSQLAMLRAQEELADMSDDNLEAIRVELERRCNEEYRNRNNKSPINRNDGYGFE